MTLPEQPTPPNQDPAGLTAASQGTAFQYVWRSPWVRVLIFLALLYLAYLIVGRVSHVLVLALVAYIIAYLAHPLLVALQRRRVPRGVGVLLVLLIIAGLLVLLSTLLVTVGTQLYDLAQQLPKQLVSLQGWFDGLAERYSVLKPLQKQLTSFTENSANSLSKLTTTYVLPYLSRYNAALVGGIFNFASTLAESLAVLIISIYMMLDYEKIGLTVLQLFPRPWQPFVLDLSHSVNRAVGGYLRGQLVIAAAVGVMIGVGLALSGVPSALALGFLAAVFNIVPYLGVIIAITPALLLAATVGWFKMIFVVIVFIIANQVEGHVLSPLILGRTTNLHPVTVVIAILIGVAVMGITGALIAVPLAALGKLLLEEYYFPSRMYKRGP